MKSNKNGILWVKLKKVRAVIFYFCRAINILEWVVSGEAEKTWAKLCHLGRMTADILALLIL